MTSRLYQCMLMLAVSSLGAFAFTARLKPRILGGLDVSNRCIAPFSSVVALEFQSPTGPIAFCSGVLVTDTIVVTTSYCVKNLQLLQNNNVNIIAVLGERDMQGTDFQEQKISIASYKIHQSFNDATLDNDIGLVQLAVPAVLGVCVATAPQYVEDPNSCTDVDKSCYMVGWGGYTEDTSFLNSKVMKGARTMVFGDYVSKILSQGQGTDLPQGSLIMESINAKQKACNLDWGDMVACKRNGVDVFRGLVSRENCQNPDLPMLITDITQYQKWINQCITNWATC